MKRKSRPLNAQIYAEASDWLVEFRSGDVDPAGRKEFYAWLRTSPEHMRAYLELAAIWNEGAGLDPNQAFDDATLMRDVRSEANVVPLDVAETRAMDRDRSTVVAQERTRPPGVAARLAIAASVAIAMAGSGWLYLQHNVYSTDIGEHRSLALSDGSRIELNANSRVRVKFSHAGRSIELLSGQAFFTVARDPERPFIVTSADMRVRALGTQFDVYRKKSGTTVTVLEGRVAVASRSKVAAAPSAQAAPRLSHSPVAHDSKAVASANAGATTASSAELLLNAGEQAVVTQRASVKQSAPNITAATAWIQGRLVFQAAPLQEVADEFNRYNQRRLVISDPGLASFNVTGVFSSTDPASLVRFLEARPGIAVTSTDNEILVARKF